MKDGEILMNICFFPIEVETNDYIDNMIDIIRDSGIVIYSLSDLKKNVRLFKKIDIFHFNWYENLDSKSYYKAIHSIIKKMIIILVLRFFNKKIIWTMHNKISHESINDKLSMVMLKFMAKKSDKIVIHSRESVNILSEIFHNKKIIDKTFYIHHVNYISNLKIDNKLVKEDLKIYNDELVFVFCGAIRKYKNIEMLINVFNNLNLKKCKLIIAGKPHTDEYRKELNELINGNKNIVTVFKFLSDDELFSLINLSDVLVLPYNKRSSLNSGSIILGFSCKKTVIAPMIGTLLDMKNEDFYYGYDYNKDEEHYEKFKQCIMKVYNDYIKNKNILKQKGEQAYSYVDRYYNSNVVKKELNDLYNKCLSE